ncbi:hypothetical protein Tco_1428616 [Tanacetum coccineum]
MRKSNAPLVGFSRDIYHPLGLVDLQVTMGDQKKQDSPIGIFNSKVLLPLQRHPRKDEDEKSWGKGSHVQMSEDDKEKTAFHTEEGVYCYIHMPKGLKNSGATLQRMMYKILVEQKGRNMEVYLEEMVIKSRLEQDLIQDVEETLYKLQRVNMELDPNECAFGME